MLQRDCFDLIKLNAQKPTHWYHGAADFILTKRQLAQLGYNENPPLPLILCTSEPDSTPPPLQTLWAEADIQTIESDPAELAVITAARIAEQGEALAIDLRRDALAMRDRLRRIKTPFWSAVAAAFLLLITLTTVNLWRIHHYATRIANTQIDQETLFRETFPGQNAPAAVTARLRSEHHHLTHLTSTTSMEMGPANSSYRNQKQADRQTSKEGTCFQYIPGAIPIAAEGVTVSGA